MKYKSGYKYQLAEVETFQTELMPEAALITTFLMLEPDGLLTISAGYAWDGPSGPTFDTKIFILGSLPHDALYQLMRMELLSHRDWRKADYELKKAVFSHIEGIKSAALRWPAKAIWLLRIWWVMGGLKIADGEAAKPKNRKPVLTV